MSDPEIFVVFSSSEVFLTSKIMMGNNNAQGSQQYEQLLQQCSNCLILLQHMRNRVMRLHSHLFRSHPPSEETSHAYFRRIDQLDKEICDCFE
ncbi:hypothetical protein KIN20_029086 [Parelaphostrongylus tenuis]|uniref:Uncharacterized protein n=1 Tax=Parelaphostrongylus tenuis TaxID=148309 RepID=A0AAD5R254_PARTN|nr:hypothetical protein KIN20_029086 [Parelaphostrongylus tenuis]